ncbi:SHOCT domain-containing protein [Clostridium beijerinckii]|uniref:SHOCT domain-containing protein n=1 Tax=Clostridium beijerinckii TaxID=1520 RepID=UPI0022267BA9|nr:SHOCT domain-containing protein [Clostridium beijerinckii]UYZ34963.1 SHOCT domain-containing protein [Clostridium beijerinckii]
MGFFDLKAVCAVCNKDVGLNRYQIANKEWICPECRKKCGVGIRTVKMTAEEIKDAIANKKIKDDEIIAINAAKKEELNNFNTTKKIGAYIEFDDTQKKWLVPDGLLGKKKNPKIYNYSDIVDYELLEDGESIAKGGLGRAVAGGVLFGGIGAIVGGVTGGKKSKTVCTSLKIKITVNDINNPVVYLKFLSSETKKSSFIYKTAFNSAQECLSVLQLITNIQEKEQEEVAQPVVSSADEILKFKSLLDNGIITQEEFESKKKQLLGI